MLFRHLYDLGQQFLEASVVCDDGETVAKKILPPLLHGRHNGMRMYANARSNFGGKGLLKKAIG